MTNLEKVPRVQGTFLIMCLIKYVVKEKKYEEEKGERSV